MVRWSCARCLRANPGEIPSTAAACRRYLQKFDEQETQIEKDQADVGKLQAVEHEQRKPLGDHVIGFRI